MLDILKNDFQRTAERYALPMVIGVSFLSILLQSQPITSTGDALNFGKDLTLAGMLAVAVVFLYRSITAKDAQIVELTKSATTALVQFAAAQSELRASIDKWTAQRDEEVKAISGLKTSVDKLIEREELWERLEKRIGS